MRVLVLGVVVFGLCACGQDREATTEKAGRANAGESGSHDASAGVRAELTEVVRVSREIVEVRLALVNAGTEPLELGMRFALREDDGPSISGLVLFEEGLQKKSFVLRDARDQPICSQGLTALAAGERRAVWARFAAPSSSRVTAQLPGLPPLSAVEVPAAEIP